METAKKVLVIGVGRSGLSAVDYLLKQGVDITLTDKNTKEKWSSSALALADRGVTLYGGDEQFDVSSFDLAIISPGIPLTEPVAQQLVAAGVPLWGELELAWRASSSSFVAITGTNGKTTTTSLVGHIFTTAGINNLVGGNIGIPLVNAVSDYGKDDWIIAEVSSFQLETAKTFKPKVAAVLNLTPDHLDRHGNMAGYGAAKENVFANQTPDDVVVLNYDNEYTKDMAFRAYSRICYFSKNVALTDGFYADKKAIYFSENGKAKKVIDIADIFIKGEHNIENAMAAAAICYHAGIKLSAIAEGLRTFRGVAHRQEWVCEKNGVTYINDSKGTNPDSTIQALKAYDNQILILGGYDKGGSFESLLPYIHQHVKGVVVLGATAEKIKETLLADGFTNIKEAGADFALAVHLAEEMAVAGDVVMLSPACASWDMFPNFEIRGEMFKKLITEED